MVFCSDQCSDSRVICKIDILQNVENSLRSFCLFPCGFQKKLMKTQNIKIYSIMNQSISNNKICVLWIMYLGLVHSGLLLLEYKCVFYCRTQCRSLKTQALYPMQESSFNHFIILGNILNLFTLQFYSKIGLISMLKNYCED